MGAILGGKFYILGVPGYDTPIWDVLALQGEREEAGERLWGDRFENYVPIRQAVPDGLAQAWFCSWAWMFMINITDMSSYNVNTPIVPFYLCLGWREWVDGSQWIWMSLILSIILDLINKY